MCRTKRIVMDRKKVIFVGWINKGHNPVDGETFKNQCLIGKLQQYCDVTELDFYNKKSHPWIYLQSLCVFLLHRRATLVLSTSHGNIYNLLKFFKRFGIRRDIVHWVIGGAFGKLVLDGKLDGQVFAKLNWNIVECDGMVGELQKAGLSNAVMCHNFKHIGMIPTYAVRDRIKSLADSNSKIRFVFVSRIMLEKGCDYILEAVEKLNDAGLTDRFIVDFYGQVDPSYLNTFDTKVEKLDNVAYCGMLDFRSDSGYEKLASYHAMLFPTYWRGEGHAGIFIDSAIAGLPILASDWAHNAEFVRNGQTGVLYPVHNIPALMEVMRKCINREYDLSAMAESCCGEAPKYDVDAVLNEEFLKMIGLID